MKKKTVQVAIGEGLDARGVALTVQTAGHFQAEIHLTDGIRRMNAKSLMGMMAMGIALGDEVTVDSDMEIADKYIPSTTKCSVAYVLTDIYQQEYWTPVVPK